MMKTSLEFVEEMLSLKIVCDDGSQCWKTAYQLQHLSLISTSLFPSSAYFLVTFVEKIIVAMVFVVYNTVYSLRFSF